MGVSENVGFTDLLTLDVFILNATTTPLGFTSCCTCFKTEYLTCRVHMLFRLYGYRSGQEVSTHAIAFVFR